MFRVLVSNIDFLKHRIAFFILSFSLIVLSIVSIVCFGLNFGLDFVGGNLIEVHFEKSVSIDEITDTLNDKIGSFEVQKFVDLTGDDESRYIIKLSAKEDGSHDSGIVLQLLRERFSASANSITLARQEYVGPSVSRDLWKKAWLSFLFTLIGIVIYIRFRFSSFVYGLSGCAALIHDILIVIGFLSLFKIEITITVVAALLTISGYSINDTIVVFDYIRERFSMNKQTNKSSSVSTYDLVNRSINLTLSRTIITSLTTLFVVLSLFFFGGSVIHDFSLTILIGVFIGTYSSIFVASGLVFSFFKKSR